MRGAGKTLLLKRVFNNQKELGLLLFYQNSNIRKQLIYAITNRKPPLFGGKASGNTNANQDEEKPKAEEPPGEGGSRETEGKRGAGDYEDISPSLEDLIMAGEFGSPKTPILLLYLLFPSVQILLLLGKLSILTSNLYPFNCTKRSIVFTLVWERFLFVNNCRKSPLSHKFD